ncbi:MAG TPA: SCP2 sterol-binding domain-containing protein [Bellilinea sp.]|nr:SCP2 sterol-binding domain-containing protein [Bellilinea sp.]
MGNTVLDNLFLQIPNLYQPERSLQDKAVIAADFTGDNPTQWTIILQGDMCLVEPRLAENADLRVGMSSEDAVALISGQLKPRLALFSGRIRVQGNMGLAMQLFDLFKLEKERLKAIGVTLDD